MTLYPDH